MKKRVDFPEIGCYCRRYYNAYTFHILPEKCTSEITVPSEVDGIPIRYVELDYEQERVSTALRKLVIPSGIRRIHTFTSFFFRSIPILIF